MRIRIFGVMILIFLSCSVDQKEKSLDGKEILNKSIINHDQGRNWDELKLSIYIQEPRVSNPSRYSIVKLNNQDHSFELIRNRGNSVSKHVIDEKGVSKVYLDDSEEITKDLVEKYRLNPERNKGYRNFYKMMYGLPMSLNEEIVHEIGKVGSSMYNNIDCYKIPIQLKEEMFSKDWIIYISKDKFDFKGMEIIFPDDKTKGERLYFDGSIRINGIKIPRVRHWHELDDAYAGSDIILKEQ